jgi:hypothetical protein
VGRKDRGELSCLQTDRRDGVFMVNGRWFSLAFLYPLYDHTFYLSYLLVIYQFLVPVFFFFFHFFCRPFIVFFLLFFSAIMLGVWGHCFGIFLWDIFYFRSFPFLFFTPSSATEFTAFTFTSTSTFTFTFTFTITFMFMFFFFLPFYIDIVM